MKDTFINGDTSNDELQNCLVLDLGTANTKSGWSNKSNPDFTIPSIVGKFISHYCHLTYCLQGKSIW